MKATTLKYSRSILHLSVITLSLSTFLYAGERFEGRYYCGEGDIEYLQLLDISRRMFAPDPEYQNVAMLYMPTWNGLVEGPTWGAWWIQNSYGPTYCGLPFYEEPLCTFLQNSQDLWFDQMGDNQTKRTYKEFNWIPPDGSLCDCAGPGYFVAKQGDGRVDIHDWGLEFTAAGALLQAELLLINRDAKVIEDYLPKLQRCVNFIETRRDPKNNLFLVGPAGNLLAPSYSGWKKADGTYDKAYLAGLSITYVAALERIIELEKLTGHEKNVKLYSERLALARKGLPQLMTPKGYFIKSLDPDGVKHGVYGAKQYGYFESSCNHDAICFRVSDDAQSKSIYNTIASIPGLRPYDLIIANYPSLDDMYVPDQGLFAFGTWVNGGHWSTCEARMIMAYNRLSKHEDARRSMKKMLAYAKHFRMDNPLVDFGNAVYQPNEPINFCYDSLGVPAAMIRGLFEYRYTADGLTIVPHIPSGISLLEQHFPIRFGKKRLYMATVGTGSVTSVVVNGQPWNKFDAQSVSLPYEDTPDEAIVQVLLGDAKPKTFLPHTSQALEAAPSIDQQSTTPFSISAAEVAVRVAGVRGFYRRLGNAGLGGTYEAAHARLILASLAATAARLKMLAAGTLASLPATSQAAADQSYVDATSRLYGGLQNVVLSYENSLDPQKQQIYHIWAESSNSP